LLLLLLLLLLLVKWRALRHDGREVALRHDAEGAVRGGVVLLVVMRDRGGTVVRRVARVARLMLLLLLLLMQPSRGQRMPLVAVAMLRGGVASELLLLLLRTRRHPRGRVRGRRAGASASGISDARRPVRRMHDAGAARSHDVNEALLRDVRDSGAVDEIEPRLVARGGVVGQRRAAQHRRDVGEAQAPAKVVEVGGNGVASTVFLDNAKYREWIFRVWQARCTDMESTALAQVAYANRKPALIIRGLSDLAGGQHGKNPIDQNELKVAEIAARVMHRVLDELP
jgi:hypothetical protein